MSTIPFETNASFLDTNKRVLFNINWDLNTSGARILELDAFKCINSNINAVTTILSPIDGSTTKSDVTLFFARTRLIKLFDIWNRILNCGLFISYNTFENLISYKLIGANIRNSVTEYLFKDNLNASTYTYPVDFSTVNIFYRIIRFLRGVVNNFTWSKNNGGKSSSTYFVLTSTSSVIEFDTQINSNYNPDNVNFINLMNELVDIVKDLIDESKLANLLLFDFNAMDFGTTQGRTNLLALDAYKSNYKALAKIDLSYLNDDTKVLAQEYIDTNSTKVVRLYPQFGSLISRNTESEAWNFRNVAIDTSVYNFSDLNPTMVPALKPYQTKYLLCSQLDMKKPLVFDTQFINWNDENDRPYVMLYNGSTLVYLPDEVKDQSTLNTLGEQPDNQLNLCSYFWKIGTSNNVDPNYDKYDDIKLKLPDGKNLYDIDKLDFLDNLTIYLKLN